MRVQNSMSYFIIWKVIKCIFIIIKGRGRNIFVHIFIHVDNSQTLPLASRIILTTLPHFRFYRKPQLCEGLEKIRSCFLVCFFKYIWHFYNYQSNSTFIYPLSNLNCCVCQLFLILLMKQNSADNANREIEAYTDLGLAFQKNAAPQLGPDFKRSLILFSNKINSQIFKRFQHFGNLIIRSSCWAHLQSQPRVTCSVSHEKCVAEHGIEPSSHVPGRRVRFFSHNTTFMSFARILYLMSFSIGNWTHVCEEIVFRRTFKIYTQGR